LDLGEKRMNDERKLLQVQKMAIQQNRANNKMIRKSWGRLFKSDRKKTYKRYLCKKKIRAALVHGGVA
jgi:hypothetical protein